nr:hypothetical protein BaRGS_013507 [Batillaria attramentaria]
MFCFRKSPQQTFQLLIHVNSYLGFPVDSAEGKTEDSYVETVVALLTVVHDSGVYNVAADRARGGAQLKYFRRMLQVLLKAEILHEVIQQLPQTTAVDVWSRLSSEVTSAYKAVTDGNDDADVREKLWSIVLLYHEFISYVRLYDSSVTARIVDKIQSLQADLEQNIITPALKNIQQKGKDSLMVQRVQALEQEESTGVADRPELQSYFTFSEGMQEEALKVEWDGCVSHVDDERYQLSKLHQITHKSASLLPMMLEKNGADLPKLIVRVFAESDQKETPGSPKKKKKTGSETLVPVLQSLGEEGISWTDLSHKVVKRVSGAVNAVLTDEKVLPVTLTKQQKLLQCQVEEGSPLGQLLKKTVATVMGDFQSVLELEGFFSECLEAVTVQRSVDAASHDKDSILDRSHLDGVEFVLQHVINTLSQSVDNLANPAMIQEAVAVWQKVIGCSRLTNEQRAVLERLSVKYLLQCVAVMTEISCFFQALLKECIRNGDQDRLLAQPAYVDPMVKCANLVSR